MSPSGKQRANVELRSVRNRELELKRIAGEISCAECRRLKLKCDKKVPCSSCLRRGCQKSCPTGIVSGCSGRHTVSSSLGANGTDTTRGLIERIAALEDALYVSAGDSSHPLLSPEQLAIKEGAGSTSRNNEEKESDAGEDSLVSAFGTLVVGEGKATRFLGASAADSVLLMEIFDPTNIPHFFNSDSLPKDLVSANRMWPFAPAHLSTPGYVTQLFSHLPPYERAASLLEKYFSNLVWICPIIDRSQVTDEIMPVFYPRKSPLSPELADEENLHDLALFFILLSCGALADITQPAINPEMERYRQLSRATLALRSYLDYGSLAACQTMFLMSCCEGFTRRKTSQESADKLTSVGFTIGASIGLHLDPSRWKLDTKLANWRRRTFWEINTIDKWRSLSSGRPWAFPRETIDCEFPLDVGASVDEEGAIVESVWQWRYRFSRDVISVLAEKFCAARPLKYSDVMELDRLVRDFKPHPLVYGPPDRAVTFATDGEYRYLPPHLTIWQKEEALLLVHRNYFARAMLEYPGDPMRCPIALSFISTYKSATVLLALLDTAFKSVPFVMDRLFGIWAVSLSCAVIIGTVASRMSTGNLAESARKELEKIISMFEAGSNHPIAQNGLKLLYRLRDNADAVRQTRDRRHPPITPVSNLEDPISRQATPSLRELVINEEELNILRGTTRYVEQRSISSSRPSERLDALHARTRLITEERPLSSMVASSSKYDIDSSRSLAETSLQRNVPTTACATLDGSLIDTTGVVSTAGQSSPSSVIETAPGSKEWSNSYDAKQAHSFTYDDYFRPFAGPQLQTSSGSADCLANLSRRSQLDLPMPQGAAKPPPLSAETNFPRQLESSHQSSHANTFGLDEISLDFDPFGYQSSLPFDPVDASRPSVLGQTAGPADVDFNTHHQEQSMDMTEAWNSFMKQFAWTHSDSAGNDGRFAV